ncbi:MAG: HAD family hydrolase [Candidatus Saccharibacteria bacterium]
MNGYAVFDVDGTLIEGQSQKELLSYLYGKRYIKLSTYLVIAAWFLMYKMGLLSDPRKVANYAFAFLKGRSVEEFSRLVDNFFDERLKTLIYPEAADIIREHQLKGRTVILLSNAIMPLVQSLAKHLGVKDCIATGLETSGGKFTGRIAGDVVFGENKTTLLRAFITAHALDAGDSWGYGDHVSDAGYLSVVKHAFAANPTQGLRNIAAQNKWESLNFHRTK